MGFHYLDRWTSGHGVKVGIHDFRHFMITRGANASFRTVKSICANFQQFMLIRYTIDDIFMTSVKCVDLFAVVLPSS